MQSLPFLLYLSVLMMGCQEVVRFVDLQEYLGAQRSSTVHSHRHKNEQATE